MLALVCACAICAPVATRADGGHVTIGVLAHRGEEAAMAAWGPTAAYLGTQLPDVQFVIRAFNNPGLEAAVRTGQIDFVLTNPGSYVNLEARYGVSRMLTLRNLREGQPYTSFGAVIFTLASRTDIRTLSDLRGRSFMAVRPEAFGGFLVAWRELAASGIDPYKDFSRLQFSGLPQDRIVYAVRDGRVDAGTVRTDTLERMAREGHIRLNDYFVINRKKVADFPFLLSTGLYPEWAFARLRHVDDELARKVAVALMLLPPDGAAARASLSAGWTVPLDYQPVHDLYRELKIGPYAYLRPVSLGDYLRMHRDELTMVVAGLLAVFLFVTAYVWRLNLKLRASQQTLQRLTGELANSNLELKYLTLHDDLTGLANHRWFHENLSTEWKRARRSGLPLSLLMIDVDEFKAHNDDLGHRAGDDSLKRIATALHGAARRPGDFVARYGGEEFAAILPGLDAAAAESVAHTMRQRVIDLDIANPRSRHGGIITVSVGVAAIAPGSDVSAEDLIESADTALYEAKAGGRNTVRVARSLNHRSGGARL